MPAITDNFCEVAVAGSATTLANPGKALGAGSVKLTDPSGWAAIATDVIFAIRRVDAQGNPIDGTYTEWIGTITGDTISGLTGTPLFGTDQTYAADGLSQIYIPVSASLWNRLITGLLAQHNQNGSHKSLTTDTLVTTGAITSGGDVGVTGAVNATSDLIGAGKLAYGTWVIPTVISAASASTLTPSIGTMVLTALAANLTINAPSGSPANAQKLVIRIKDNGTPRTLTWNAIFRAGDIPLPTSTVANKTMYICFIYNADDSKWDCVSSIGNF